MGCRVHSNCTWWHQYPEIMHSCYSLKLRTRFGHSWCDQHGNSWQMEWCSYVQWSEASYHLSIHFQIIGYHLPVNYFNQSALSMILMWYIRRVTNRNIDDQQMISFTQNKLDKYLIVIDGILFCNKYVAWDIYMTKKILKLSRKIW